VSRANVIRWGALAVGIILFAAALSYINVSLAMGTIRRLGVALPLALLFSGLWHLARTLAWSWCFPATSHVSFLRLTRVRLAAEAFSYLTLRGIAGEPLKVVLLNDRVDPREATAAVALERLAYLIGTTFIVGIGSLIAILFLPLTRGWFRVFRAFAMAATVLAVLVALAIRGRGTYVQALLTRFDRRWSTSIASGRVSRFVTAVERQMLDLVRGNPRRLALLMVATVAAYACMALEAWVILRASGTPVSGIGALAIETFSRVASFASAFIPANLGALEASSLAAVAAIGVAGGGAALALARRLRGLFWAGVGLAIYPRRTHPEPGGSYRGRTGVVPGSYEGQTPLRPRYGAGIHGIQGSDPGTTPVRPPYGPGTTPVLLYLPEDAGVEVSAGVRLAGLAVGERIVRAALRAEYRRILVWQPEGAANARLFDSLARQLEGVDVLRSVDAWREAIATLDPALPVTVVGAGTVVSPALLADAAALDMGEDAVRDVPAGADWPVTGAIRVRAGDAMHPAALSALLSTRYANDARPSGEDVSYGRARLAIRMVESNDVQSAERTLRRSIFKDTDGRIAQFNRRLSLPISIALIRTPLTANQLSILLVAVGFYSGWLFSLGHYWTGLLAACLSLVASILDGSDGEIARLKYQESALGCWIETVGDYSYYIAVFIGLTFGVVRQTGHPAYYWIGLIALGGTLLTFALLIYLRARITGGQPTRMHAVAKTRFHADPSLWSRLILKLAFLCTRAAMPYGILILALLNALPVALLLAALGGNLYWISLVAKLRDLLRDETEMMAAQ